MGKTEKEDSGFGFKDKAKALDTLRLLEEHDPNYRRLTVRGLLGRAKRVLSMTKAEDKIKNIKEAMEVFENWLADLEKNKESKTDKAEKKKEKPKKENSDDEKPDPEVPGAQGPADSVPGLGFKDAAAAADSLTALAGRDPDYQRLAVKGLVGRAKRVLTCTKDEAKLKNINEAIAIFEKFLDDFEKNNLSKLNNAYLGLSVVKHCLTLAEKRGLKIDKQKAFIAAYSDVDGEYKRLRTVCSEDGKSWDIVRNSALEGLKKKSEGTDLFAKSEPTDEHLQMILWAYSPEPSKLSKLVEAESGGRKRKSSGGDDDSSKKSKK